MTNWIKGIDLIGLVRGSLRLSYDLFMIKKSKLPVNAKGE